MPAPPEPHEIVPTRRMTRAIPMDPCDRRSREQVLLDPVVWTAILAAAVYGVFVGAVPGLTATMAMALLVPVTYWLHPCRPWRRS